MYLLNSLPNQPISYHLLLRQGCRDTLGGVSVSDDQFTESICTVILLEGVDLETLIVEVMERRLAGVAERLTSGGSVRNQIADVSHIV